MRSLSLLVLASALVVGSGCSSSDETAAAAESTSPVVPASGTRLHAKLVTGGGAREVVGFHDAERNEDCTFQPAEDGRMRCLPGVVPFYGASGFSDPACTVPLVGFTQSCDAAPTYGTTYDPGACAQTAKELHKLVAITGPTYVQGPNGCTAQSATPPPGAPGVRALGELVSWTDFVEGKPTVAPGDPISERVLVGSDGSRQHSGFRNESLGTSCSFETMSDGVTRCLPETNRGPVLYDDTTCTTPLAVNFGTSCNTAERPFWLDAMGASKCRDIRAVFSVSSTFRNPGSSDVIQLHERSAMNPLECNAGSSYTVSIVGSGLRSVDADITASLPQTNRVGGGDERLVPALVADGDKPALVPGWYDRERQVDCTFKRASDGKLRCLPTATAARLFSTDTACKSQAHVAILTEISCTGFSSFAIVASTTCPTTTRVFLLGSDPHDVANASTETAPGRCASFPSLTRAYDATEVDAAQFVEGAELPE
jgi:hypothetical protein